MTITAITTLFISTNLIVVTPVLLGEASQLFISLLIEIDRLLLAWSRAPMAKPAQEMTHRNEKNDDHDSFKHVNFLLHFGKTIAITAFLRQRKHLLALDCIVFER